MTAASSKQPVSAFPTTLADLTFDSHPSNTSLYNTLKSLRTSTLSIPNRLTSIIADSAYVITVSTEYGLPLLANERCGSWYIPPSLKAGSVYFKSTDGHYSQWSFSLRRLNLQMLDMLGERGGAVIVDSTRRGKSMPDALRWSAPIWVGVINRTLFPERGSWGALQTWYGDGLREMGREVSIERTVEAIEGRMGRFVKAFKGLGLDLDELRRKLKNPIRIVWEINGMGPRSEEGGRDLCDETDDQETNLLVLCSASRRVRGAEVSEGGYIQGAGDDSEAWSRGLTPELFWPQKDLLLSTPEDELPSLIARLKEATPSEEDASPTLIAPTKIIYITRDTNSSVISAEKDKEIAFDMIINCNRDPLTSSSPRVLNLHCRTGKLGSRDLRDKLLVVKSVLATTFEKNADCRILITCSTAKDLSVGVVVMLLCLFFDDAGAVRNSVPPEKIEKTLVKQRLAWISSSKPDVNPSRSTLQSVNTVLMQPP